MRIIFAGTPDFACPSLRALAASPHEVISVYTQPDRAHGRGRKHRAPPVKQLALELGLAVEQPESLRDPAIRAAIAGMEVDLMVVVAYGQILPRAVLEAPARGCINVHASLLPRWRGAAPIQRAILAGDSETGVTIMRMAEGLDTGDILLQRRCPITPETTGGDLHDRLAGMGAEALTAALEEMEGCTLVPRPQDERWATYARKLEKREARLDWNESAQVLARTVRAFNPWPVAHARLGGDSVRIWRAGALDEAARDPVGSVVRADAEGIDVATGEGVLRIEALQWPGARVLSAREAENGHHLFGRRFS